MCLGTGTVAQVNHHAGAKETSETALSVCQWWHAQRPFRNRKCPSHIRGYDTGYRVSVTFGIVAILALIVMYDAAGVRRSVSRQSVVLNRIVQEFRLRRPITEVERDLREFIGHTPFQVITGAALGIILAWSWLAITAL